MLGLMFFTVTACRAEVDARRDISYLPETNPYRNLLIDLQSLSESDADALLAWGNGGRTGDDAVELPVSLKPVVNRLVANMRATRSKKTQAGDWPLRGDEGRTTSLSGMTVQPVRTLSRVLMRATEEMPAGEAVDVWLALIQFGRNLSDEGTLVSGMMAVVLENAAFEPMRVRCGELSADELLALARGKAALRAPQTLSELFEAERELFFIPTMDQEYLPALRLLVDQGIKQSVAAFERVEVRGIMELNGGRGKLLLKERDTGRTFTVGINETVSGFELVSFDLKERTAVIRHAGREAKVDLSNNKIAVQRPELHPLRMLFWSLEDGQGTDEDLEGLAAQVVKQGGPESYIAYTKQEYVRVVQEVLALALRPKEAEPDALPKCETVIVGMVVKAFHKIARLNTACRVRDRMLDRAIQIRQEKSGAATTAQITDPYGEPKMGFKEETLEDGALRIESRFEKTAGTALSCEFPAAARTKSVSLPR